MKKKRQTLVSDDPSLSPLDIAVTQASRRKDALETLVSSIDGAKADPFLSYAVRTLREVEHWIEEYHSGRLTGVNFKRTTDGWMVIVKAEHKKKRVVAFSNGYTLADALVILAWKIGHRQLKWRQDKYP